MENLKINISSLRKWKETLLNEVAKELSRVDRPSEQKRIQFWSRAEALPYPYYESLPVLRIYRN